ncbi:unnamed protein product [Mytilus coruscus]|uniref:Integrase catalytic domain-containing protein n=1 Tax=Mytilus coruscus TaxID=42192 RepID=A0A6J8DAQ4_MYTCO|nr:unnamed protein product [Mytilus coruscus]
MPDGIYVKGFIEGVDVTFTADTGACKTVLSEKIFNKIPLLQRPKLRKTSPLTGASGERSLEIVAEIVVANIEDQCLLGIDILQGQQGGPADILLRKGVINLKGVSIPCIQVKKSEFIRKVTAADHFIIPGYCEAVIDVCIERNENDELLASKEFIIEPSEEFIANNKIAMAACVVDIKDNVTVKARVLNPRSEEVSIKQDTIIGKASSFLKILSSLKDMENADETENFSAIRRLCYSPRDCHCSDQDMLEPLKCGPCKKCKTRMLEMESNIVVKDVCRTVQTRAQKRNVINQRSESLGDENVSSWGKGINFDICNKFDLKKLQSEDEDLKVVIESKKKGGKPDYSVIAMSSPACRNYFNLWDSLEIYNDILFKRFHKQDGTGEFLQFIVPTSMKKEIMYHMHNTVLSGHLGQKKSRGKALQKFFWYLMKEDINNYVNACDICAQNKPPHKTPKAPLGKMGVGAPMDRLATDIIGPLPRTPRGNRYILIISDHFIKWVEIIPIPDQSAITCAEKILNEVISRFGCPLSLHSDRGSIYESQIFNELCVMLEIKKTRTTVRNPKCNGLSERFNKTLWRMIRAYLKGEQTDWDINVGS